MPSRLGDRYSDALTQSDLPSISRPRFHQRITGRRFSAASRQTSTSGDIVPFNLADIGEGIAEVEVLQWFVQVGDHVQAFDRVCEVQSDKATVEISSRFDGEIVKIYHKVGGIAKVGEPLIDIRRSGSGGAPPGSSSPLADRTPDAEPAKVVNKANGTGSVHSEAGAGIELNGAGKSKPLSTPAVRGLIKGLKLDIRKIPATGRDGRVTKEDVQRYLTAEGKYDTATIDPPTSVADTTPASEVPLAPQSANSLPARAAGNSVDAAPAAGGVPEDSRVAVRGFMRTMIKTMQAQTAIPHFGYSDEYEVDGVLDLRKRLLDDAAGTKLTYMPIIIKALSLALTDFPEINSKFSKDMEEVVLIGSHNIGIAVDTPTGLVVPNIKAVQSKSILQIADELHLLATMARENRLTPEQLSGGTVTLSNVGAIGGTYTSPILMPGEACIGAIGAIETVPRYQADGSLAPVRVMRISWSADHRLLAGATVARFSNRLKALLQDPSRMLLSLR